MRFDNLRAPISDDDPTGPDLDEEGDNDYLNYTMLASGNLPARFFGPDGQPFDRSTIDLENELTTIAGFLRRTRDARLLTLDARFNALGGNIIGFSEAVQGIAIIVETFWEGFHPRESEGDFIVRQNSIEGLDDQVQIILPLQYAPFVGGGRTRVVSFRNYLVASGKAPPREGEDPVPLDAVTASISADSNEEQVKTVYTALKAAMDALGLISRTFAEKAAPEFVPSFDKLLDTLNQMIEVLIEFRPALAPERAERPADAETYDDEVGGSTGGGGPSTVPAGAVKTHEAAATALGVVESYFVHYEPSNPALILVHQARMLLGRPLVEALEALMPSPSSSAALKFETGFRFEIDISRMRAVTEHAFENVGSLPPPDVPLPPQPKPAPAVPAPPPPEPASEPVAESAPMGDSEADAAGDLDIAGAASAETPEPQPVAVAPAPEPAAPEPEVPAGPVVFRAPTRAAAADILQATEAFYRVVEPSSPIPVLLARARSYLNRDFASILGEIIPKES